MQGIVSNVAVFFVYHIEEILTPIILGYRIFPVETRILFLIFVGKASFGNTQVRYLPEILFPILSQDVVYF